MGIGSVGLGIRSEREGVRLGWSPFGLVERSEEGGGGIGVNWVVPFGVDFTSNSRKVQHNSYKRQFNSHVEFSG